jgi:predicted Zn-ribbon and HTH transcriptional regulator
LPEITLKGYLCERCGHTWVPKENIKPKVCPKCKSPYWDTPRKISTEQIKQSSLIEDKVTEDVVRE